MSDHSHYLRPDAVVRSGVVQPIGGFNPPMAVMQNAQAFTTYPYNQTFDTNSLNTALNGNVPGQWRNAPMFRGLGATTARCEPWEACWVWRKAPMLRDANGRWWQPNGPGLLERFKIFLATRKVLRNVQQQTGVAGLGAAAQLLGLTPDGPANVMGPQINPDASARRDMLSLIATNQQPQAWRSNALDTIANRWNGKGWR